MNLNLNLAKDDEQMSIEEDIYNLKRCIKMYKEEMVYVI